VPKASPEKIGALQRSGGKEKISIFPGGKTAPTTRKKGAVPKKRVTNLPHHRNAFHLSAAESSEEPKEKATGAKKKKEGGKYQGPSHQTGQQTEKLRDKKRKSTTGRALIMRKQRGGRFKKKAVSLLDHPKGQKGATPSCQKKKNEAIKKEGGGGKKKNRLI